MKPGGIKLQLRAGLRQRLGLTPRLQQSLRLLQLSSLELVAELQQALESNIMLEQQADGEEQQGNEPAADSSDSETSEGLQDADMTAEQITDELPVDVSWEDLYGDRQSYAGERRRAVPIEALGEENESLQAHLLGQLKLLDLGAQEQLIASYLVDALDSNGYLTEDPAELCAALCANGQLNSVQPQAFERVLSVVQDLEPTGVGARSLQECLRLQLHQLARDGPAVADALTLVEGHLPQLGQDAPAGLAHELGWHGERFKRALQLVRSLDPHPGAQVSSGRTTYIVPDLYVSRKNGRWELSLNQEALPRLRINPQYLALARGRAPEARRLKTDLQEARWLLRNLHDRQEMLLKVANNIVLRQRAFLEHGEEAMKPLVLGDVADALQVHESTVSRAISGKYIHSPRGVHELKFFFSGSLGDEERRHSSTAVRAIVRRFIEQEPASKPLSDSKLATLLSEKGIRVARRTVAKYRESMRIPPSHERKYRPATGQAHSKRKTSPID